MCVAAVQRLLALASRVVNKVLLKTRVFGWESMRFQEPICRVWGAAKEIRRALPSLQSLRLSSNDQPFCGPAQCEGHASPKARHR